MDYLFLYKKHEPIIDPHFDRNEEIMETKIYKYT